MTEHDNDNLSNDMPFGDAPDERPMEVETPRRAASAQFVVDAPVATGAAMRDAMDPANQSLADALRLSFRVLQVVILLLVVLFLFSGLKRVPNDQTGVLAVWGRIVSVGDSEALTPGFKFSKWPYPAAEFILFSEENRSVDLGNSFWPRYGEGVAFEAAVSAATRNDTLRPGRDGSIITKDAELAHVQLSARYAVLDPAMFVRNVDVDGETADRLVRLALQRATIEVGARIGVEEIAEGSEVLAAEIERSAQQSLEKIRCGLMLQTVHVPRTSPPLAVRKSMEDVQNTRVEVEELLVRAQQDAAQILTGVAGRHYREIHDLIETYEQALDVESEARQAELLDQINALLESEDTTGQVASIIERARAHKSLVERTLGRATKRFHTYLPEYRENPEMVVRKLWLQARTEVLNADDVEIFWAPSGVRGLRLQLEGLETVQALRRKRQLSERETESMMQFRSPTGGTMRAADYKRHNEPGRTLDIDEEGNITNRGKR